MGVDDEKIVRIPGDTLMIKVSPEEEAYRKKYLPDLKRLTDEKLVCTVCSASLAQSIHKGKDLFIHRALQVLVCEACYNFYGDGCFSADEDGDDKYCRWCGQGGTLYLCSACNCAFCQKCTKQNLKASVLAELENDDWKCYICNPRPLFGCRTICWGAQQLNKIGKQKEQERLKKVKERLEKLEAKKKESSERKSRKVSSSEDEAPSKKRRRSSDGDSSSPEVLPKRQKRESRGKTDSRNLNGSSSRRRKDSSSNSEPEEERKTTRRSKASNVKEKLVESSSEDDSAKSRKDKFKKKNKTKDDSDDSSDSGKKKSKRRSAKKKDSSEDDSSEDEKSKKKKKHFTKKRNDSTDDSSDEKKKKRKHKKKRNNDSSDDSTDESKNKNKKLTKKKVKDSSDELSDEDDQKSSKRKLGKKEINKKSNIDSDAEHNKTKKATDSEDVSTISAEDILVKKRIKLAILWLTSVVQDISELGTLISLRATNFSKKKINTENLKSYEDVLNCVSKIKQLISGVHNNYDHIEKTLDSHLKPWKKLTGLDDEKSNEESAMAVDADVSKTDNNSAANTSENYNDPKIKEVNGVSEKSTIENNEKNLNWSDDSVDLREMITKASESLDKSQNESEAELESSKNKSVGNETVDHNSKLDVSDKESEKTSEVEKEDPSKSDGESKLQTPKKSAPSDIDSKTHMEELSKSKKDRDSDNKDAHRSPEKRSPEKKNSKDEKSMGKDGETEKKAVESEG